MKINTWSGGAENTRLPDKDIYGWREDIQPLGINNEPHQPSVIIQRFMDLSGLQTSPPY